MRGYFMPGSYPDSEASSIDSMAVNVPWYNDPPSPRRSSQPDEAVEAIRQKLEDAFHVSSAEQKKAGEGLDRLRVPGPGNWHPTSKFEFTAGQPLPWATRSRGPAVPKAEFTFGPGFGLPTSTNSPITSQNTIFSRDVPVYTPPSEFATPTDHSKDGSHFKKFWDSKPVTIPRGKGPPSLFQAPPDYNPSATFPVFTKSAAVPKPGTSEDAQPSPKTQYGYLQPPEDRMSAEPSPAKRRFGHNEGLNKSPLATPTVETFTENACPDASQEQDDEPSSKARAVPAIHSAVDFTSWAQTVLCLDAEDMVVHSRHLNELYGFFVTFTDCVVQNTKSSDQRHSTISRLNKKAAGLGELIRRITALGHKAPLYVELHGKLDMVSQQIKDAKRGLVTNERAMTRSRNMLMERLLGSLKCILENYRRKQKAISASAAELEAKNASINRLRLATLNTEDELKATKESLKVAKETVEQLQIQLQVDGLKVANDLKNIQSSQRDRLDHMLSDHKNDKKEALSAQKEQYTALIDDAEAKFRLYKDATARVEGLAKDSRKLKRDKADIVLAKAAMEKELRDLELQAKQWMTFEDAYKQVKAEFDQLEGDFNDVVAERDDLRKAKQVTPVTHSATKRATGVQDMSPAHTGVGALKSYDADLTLLEIFWRRQQHFAEMSKRQTQAEIDEVNEDITETARELAAFEPLENPDEDSESSESNDDDDVAPQPAAGNSQPLQMLDTLLAPLAPEDTTSTPNSALAHKSSRQVGALPAYGPDTRPAPKIPSIWADKAAGRIAPAASHKKAARSMNFSNVHYQGDKVSTTGAPYNVPAANNTVLGQNEGGAWGTGGRQGKVVRKN